MAFPEVKNKLKPSIILEHKKKWKAIYKGQINLKWLAWYSSCSLLESPDFVPESIYYSIIEPLLNKPEFSIAFSDKNFYDKFYPEGLFPDVLIRNIDGDFFSKNYEPLNNLGEKNLKNYLQNEKEIIIKPSVETGGGQNVKLFIVENGKIKNNNGETVSLELIKKTFKENFIIQRVLKQHSFFSQFNKSSINTIRALTFRNPSTNTIEILHLILRIGTPGQFVDNSRAGGFSVGINSQGVLNHFAVKKDGEKYYQINEFDLTQNLTIPFFEELMKTAIFIASKNIHHRLLGLDLTIDQENKIRCIEVNNTGNEINFYQLNNGPLFGKFTDEVIAFCEENKLNLFKNFKI